MSRMGDPDKGTSYLSHAESHVDRLGCLNRFDDIELNMLAHQSFEQAPAAAEQYRGKVDRDFVDEAALEELPGDICARDIDIFFSCESFRGFKCRIHTVHKMVDALLGHIRRLAVRNDDRWDAALAGRSV